MLFFKSLRFRLLFGILLKFVFWFGKKDFRKELREELKDENKEKELEVKKEV